MGWFVIIISEILETVCDHNQILVTAFSCFCKVEGIIEKSIETVLPSNPPDVESLRVYLTISCCHMFDNPSNYRIVICPFGKALVSLGNTPSKVLGKSRISFS